MGLIEFIVLTAATAASIPYATIILLALIPFVIVALIVGATFVSRRKQKRRMRNM